MPKYRILLRGENFLLEIDGRVQHHGFMTTRFVETPNPQDAVTTAIDLIRTDPELQSIMLNDPKDHSMIFLEELAEIESFYGVSLPGTGYTFFQTDPL